VSDSGVSVVDLAGSYPTIGDHTRVGAVEKIDDEYGLDIPQLHVVNISLPAEVEKALDARTQMNLLGDMSQYREYQMAQAIPGMANSEAGGLASAAMGLGMGANMANQVLGGFGAGGFGMGGTAPQPAAQAPPPLPAAWHMAENGQTVGPMSLPQLAAAAQSQRLQADTLVWTSGMAAWRAAGEIPELAGLFAAAPPPLPGSSA
jgi:membrane protease subunit (stomatin/prohibitin family)